MEIKPQKNKIKEILKKGVDKILPSREGLEKLMGKRSIRLYLGIDPTAPRLHLGHSIALRKLQEFADIGAKAFLVIGTGTVLAGDPSLRDEARKKITKEEVIKNIKTWKKQAGKILDFSKVEIKYNGDWLLKLKLVDIINIASHISAVKLFQRDSFRRRIKKKNTVWMHETLYPLLQGYDSVELGVDLEIGGTDQVFNMLIGRELEKKMKNKEKFILTVPMIMGVDGKPMSKSSGNCIWLEDSASEMYGKIMSMPDSLIFSYFELLTSFSLEEIRKMKKSGENPKELKSILAKEIIKTFHNEKEAEKAEAEFRKVFKEKRLPTEIPSVKVEKKDISILDLLVKINLAFSKAEARRLISQGGVKIGGEVKNDWQEIIIPEQGMVIQVGRRKFVRLE